jgi:hypothetical protein
MRKLVLAALAGSAVALTGCGSKTTIDTRRLTDEQKKQIAEEDRRVADEESQGTAGKQGKGKKGKP